MTGYKDKKAPGRKKKNANVLPEELDESRFSLYYAQNGKEEPGNAFVKGRVLGGKLQQQARKKWMHIF